MRGSCLIRGGFEQGQNIGGEFERFNAHCVRHHLKLQRPVGLYFRFARRDQSARAISVGGPLYRAARARSGKSCGSSSMPPHGLHSQGIPAPLQCRWF